MRLLLIVGPTAAGKSALAESVAERFEAELVSADASQVYRGLDIGTAKPTPEEQRRYRYHGIDLRSAARRCTAGAFGRWARRRVRTIDGRGRLPVLVGGSGFYVQAAIFGLDRLPASRPRFRDALQRWCDRVGVPRAHAMLASLDAEWAAGIGINDRQRILRALEVVLRTGRRRQQLLQTQRDVRLQATTLWVGLDWDRAALAARIERRVDAMLECGWVAEVEALLGSGLDPRAHALQAIGYRQLVEHVQGRVSLQEARQRIIDTTRQYAKRQRTWCRRWEQVRWWYIQDEGQLVEAQDAALAAIRRWHEC